MRRKCRDCGSDITHRTKRTNYCKDCTYSRKLSRMKKTYAENKYHTGGHRKDQRNFKCLEALPWSYACNEHSDKSMTDIIQNTLKQVEKDKRNHNMECLLKELNVA